MLNNPRKSVKFTSERRRPLRNGEKSSKFDVFSRIVQQLVCDQILTIIYQSIENYLLFLLVIWTEKRYAQNQKIWLSKVKQVKYGKLVKVSESHSNVSASEYQQFIHQNIENVPLFHLVVRTEKTVYAFTSYGTSKWDNFQNFSYTRDIMKLRANVMKQISCVMKFRDRPCINDVNVMNMVPLCFLSFQL